MSKIKQLIPFYMKISQKLKDKLHDQAKIERIPMATLVSEILEMGPEYFLFDAIQQLFL